MSKRSKKHKITKRIKKLNDINIDENNANFVKICDNLRNCGTDKYLTKNELKLIILEKTTLHNGRRIKRLCVRKIARLMLMLEQNLRMILLKILGGNG
jgi:hypothetical protein